jgi:holliday junction DNA helicase RuvA
MSTLTPSSLVRAIAERDVATLVRVPGVGRKTAERIALELADKLDTIALGAAPSVRGAAAQEAVGALVALGYSASEATAAVQRSIEDQGPEEDAKVLIRKALARTGR